MQTCPTCAGLGYLPLSICPKCFGRKKIYEEAVGLVFTWLGTEYKAASSLRVSGGRVTFANVTPLNATIVNGCTVSKQWPATIEPTTVSATFLGACPLTMADRGKRGALSLSINGVSASATGVISSIDMLDAKANAVLSWSASFQLEG